VTSGQGLAFLSQIQGDFTSLQLPNILGRYPELSSDFHSAMSIRHLFDRPQACCGQPPVHTGCVSENCGMAQILILSNVLQIGRPCVRPDSIDVIHDHFGRTRSQKCLGYESVDKPCLYFPANAKPYAEIAGLVRIRGTHSLGLLVPYSAFARYFVTRIIRNCLPNFVGWRYHDLSIVEHGEISRLPPRAQAAFLLGDTSGPGCPGLRFAAVAARLNPSHPYRKQGLAAPRTTTPSLRSPGGSAPAIFPCRCAAFLAGKIPSAPEVSVHTPTRDCNAVRGRACRKSGPPSTELR